MKETEIDPLSQKIQCGTFAMDARIPNAYKTATWNKKPTSNDKYDGIKTSIMAFFSHFIRNSLAHAFFIFYHTFSLSINWLTFSLFPVALVVFVVVSVNNIANATFFSL